MEIQGKVCRWPGGRLPVLRHWRFSFLFFSSLFRDFPFLGRGQGTINRNDKAWAFQTGLCSCCFMTLIIPATPSPVPPDRMWWQTGKWETQGGKQGFSLQLALTQSCPRALLFSETRPALSLGTWEVRDLDPCPRDGPRISGWAVKGAEGCELSGLDEANREDWRRRRGKRRRRNSSSSNKSQVQNK